MIARRDRAMTAFSIDSDTTNGRLGLTRPDAPLLTDVLAPKDAA